jgi:SSS family solute:Na+ symporter/sodium/proline symporter
MENTWEAKMATAVVTLLALGMAMSETRSVFQLVILSWSTLASAFAPLLTIYAIGRRISEGAAIAAMIAGVAAALLWRTVELHTMVYEGMPGILTGLIVAMALSRAAEHRQAGFGVYATKGDS